MLQCHAFEGVPKGYWALQLEYGNSCVTYDNTSNLVRASWCDPSDYMHQGQVWNPEGGRIISAASKKCLVRSGADSVRVERCTGREVENWTLEYYADGTFRVRDLGGEACLDMHLKTRELHMHPCHSGGNQRFWKRAVQLDVDHLMEILVACSKRAELAFFGYFVLLVPAVAAAAIVCQCRHQAKQQVAIKSVMDEMKQTRQEGQQGYSHVLGLLKPLLEQIPGSDASSECTLGSWSHVSSGQPCCFLPETYFQVVTEHGPVLTSPYPVQGRRACCCQW